MSYIVKYIGNCAENNIDIEPLYRKDVADGDTVVLVCEKSRANVYSDMCIPVVNSIEAISDFDGNVIMLCTEGSGYVPAVECAKSLWSGECQVYIKYDGFYTVDPQQSDFGKIMDKIDYDEALEICSCGYNGVNTAMIETAKKCGVAIRLLSYNGTDTTGTVIKEVLDLGGAIVKGVIKEPDISIITLMGIPDVIGITYRIFQTVSDAGIIVDIISLPASYNGKRDISFTVKKEDKLTVRRVLMEKQREFGFNDIIVDDNVAKISVVGAALRSSHGVAAAVFKIMYENNINLHLINTSEIKISVVVDKNMADLAVHKIHEVFIN